jgi:hypothetical protein
LLHLSQGWYKEGQLIPTYLRIENLVPQDIPHGVLCTRAS